MPSVYIIGGNRGIGLELVRSFRNLGWDVWATVRPHTRKSKDASLSDLEETGASVVELDYLDESSINEAAKSYADRGLDILINCGGVHVKPREWTEHTRDIVTEKLMIMAVGPFLVSKAFLPNLRNSKSGAKIINISSKSGSNELNIGGHMAYRMAKSALNSQTVTMAREFEKNHEPITIISLYPGFVATKLTDFDCDDDMATCIAGMMQVILSCDAQDNGSFIKWDGTRLPW